MRKERGRCRKEDKGGWKYEESEMRKEEKERGVLRNKKRGG